MAARGDTMPTLLDFARRQDNQGNIVSDLIEQLHEDNEILTDMVVLEANGTTSHLTTVRTGLPSVAWRLLNYGVAKGKSQTKQVTDSMGMLEAYAEVDKDLADLNGNTAMWRMQEDAAYLEAMNQEMASTLFYGDTDSAPAEFIGLTPRFSSYGTDSTQSSYNVIHGGGTGSDNTSIWLVVWGPTTCHGIYPKGSQAGFRVQDLGEQTLEDGSGNQFQGYRTHYQWKLGLTVRNWEYVVRIANIDVSELGDAGESGFDGAPLYNLMIKAYHKIRSWGRGRAAFYCNNEVLTALDLIASNDSKLALKHEELDGMPVIMFRGIPIRRCDQILNTEAAVSAA